MREASPSTRLGDCATTFAGGHGPAVISWSTWAMPVLAMVFGVKHALDYRQAWYAVAVYGLAFLMSLALAFGLSTLFARPVS